jgi:hypothetical protein
MVGDLVRMPTFENVINRTLGQVVEANIVQAVKMGLRLERGLTRLNLLFYRTLAQTIVNTSASPSLGEFSPPPWKPLAATTVARKGHANFFYDTGELAEWFQKTSAADLLGESIVRVDTRSGKVGFVNGFQRSILRTSLKGKRWVQTLTFSNSKANGMRGFIKSSELERWLHPTLTVLVFSKMPGGLSTEDHGSVAKFLTGGDQRIGYKLTNVAGHNDRPIVSEFLEWWIETRAKRLVDKFGRINP